jgi:hypothetical protein
MNKRIEPHQWANGNGEVLILKRIAKDRKANGGFLYPSGIGSVVTCPDWNPEPVCGGGIHGWPWGFGLGEGSEYDIIDDIWLVLAAKPENVIGELESGLKCKAKDPVIRFEGKFKDAIGIVAGEQGAIIKNLAAASGERSKLAASGERSKLAASGYASNLAASGDDSVCAIAADSGRVKVGKRGAFAIAYWTESEGWKFRTGKVGEDGVKADTWYEVRKGKLLEVS